MERWQIRLIMFFAILLLAPIWRILRNAFAEEFSNSGSASSGRTVVSRRSGRESDADFRRFLIMAHGSATEVEYLIFLSAELNYVSKSEFDEFTEKVIVLRKQLRKLIDKLK